MGIDGPPQGYNAYQQYEIEPLQEQLRIVPGAFGAVESEGGTYEIGPTVEAIHDAGTCRMRDDPDTSATDRYGQIHEISGLYVADSSVIPTSGTANPTLTTVALAFRTADHIIRQLN